MTVAVRADDLQPRSAQLRVAGREVTPVSERSWIKVEIDSITDHEFIILE
ncbi:hypothetical protein ACHHV8_16240 [Paenibacillus sp. TAB 01]